MGVTGISNNQQIANYLECNYVVPAKLAKIEAAKKPLEDQETGGQVTAVSGFGVGAASVFVGALASGPVGWLLFGVGLLAMLVGAIIYQNAHDKLQKIDDGALKTKIEQLLCAPVRTPTPLESMRPIPTSALNALKPK